jgi:hypothetical protein
LPHQLARDGYVLLRSALDRDLVWQARREVLERLAAVGEIDEPIDAAVASGTSRRTAMHPDLGAFWRAVCEAPQIRALTHGAQLAEISAALLGKPTVPFDFLWLRTMLEGRASPLHFDHVYMNRGSWNVLTAWVPLGDVPMGPVRRHVRCRRGRRFSPCLRRPRSEWARRQARARHERVMPSPDHGLGVRYLLQLSSASGIGHFPRSHHPFAGEFP